MEKEKIEYIPSRYIVKFRLEAESKIGQIIQLELFKEGRQTTDYASYQLLYGETEVEGKIINVSTYHIIIEINGDIRMVRFRDIIGFKFKE